MLKEDSVGKEWGVRGSGEEELIEKMLFDILNFYVKWDAGPLKWREQQKRVTTWKQILQQ